MFFATIEGGMVHQAVKRSRPNSAAWKITMPIVSVTTVAALYIAARSRSSADCGRSHSPWSRISHVIKAALARSVAALNRQGPMVADSCHMVGYARLTAPVANAAIITFDIPAANRHGRFA